MASSDEVRELLADSGAEVRPDVPLAGLTTLRVGGPATVAECADEAALVRTVGALDAAEIPVLLLAGGSNLLIADEGFPGVVVRIANAGVELTADSVLAEAGAVWDDVVARTVAAGFGGLECLSGIPGSAGATPVQNVGAYGVEVAGLLRRVRLLDRASGAVRWAEPAELGFGYRTSLLKHSDAAVVLAVEFALDRTGASAPLRYRELAATFGAEEGETRPAAEVRDAVLRLRASKGMVLNPDDHDTWSAGSFFTNPVVPEPEVERVRAAIAALVGDVPVPVYPAPDGVKFSAGWLIERAGFGRGFPGADAPARLSTKHTLALTNRGAATAADLVALAHTVRDGVAERFGIRLHPEPVTVGLTV
ncbi:UDP-N-acetylmuramate dehydrogenase [Nocardia asteroides]|uniref:UDP-N-acetylmuramate dehydrogenase n=1 Tax=Nocardia asteroides TaxID=1824 RepID=UPI0022B836BC|nr:UDP-N-acetylmuramate dehydrogenase [Nocardia asteroides]